MLLGLTQNLAILISISVIYAAINYRTAQTLSPYAGWALGALFGLGAILVMAFTVVIEPGIFFDTRAAIVGVGAALLGPIPGLIAAGIAAAYRLWLGGAGQEVGVLNVMGAAVIGIVFHTLVKVGRAKPALKHFAALGLGISAFSVAIFALLPIGFVETVLGKIAVPYTVAIMAGTAIMGFIMTKFQIIRDFDTKLAAETGRYRDLFENSAAAILVEDVSGLSSRILDLRASGVEDIREEIRTNPRLVDELRGTIRVVRANAAAHRLFKTRSDADLVELFRQPWTPHNIRSFENLLQALWDGHDVFQERTTMRAADGREISVNITFPLSLDPDRAREMPVSILDLSALQAMEAALEDQRKRLEEILWGTDVGTWEWHVQTGETRFNDRWAEIVGYTLAELDPVSIETWKALCHPDDFARSGEALRRVFTRETAFYSCEVRMRHKDGRWIWVHDRGKVVEWDEHGQPVRMSGTHTDIHVQKTSVLKLERLSKIRAALIKAQGLVLHAGDERALFQRVCDALYEGGGYQLVWVAVPKPRTPGVLELAAKTGAGATFMNTMLRPDGTTGSNQNPAMIAMETREAVFEIDGVLVPLAELGERAARVDHNASCVAAYPLHQKTAVVAVLCVQSRDLIELGPEEATLLMEFAGALALALSALDSAGTARRAMEALAVSAMSAVSAISKTLEKRDPYTSGHSERVAELSVAIARELGWDEFRIEGLKLGALLHDIGKIYVPAEILNRPGRLSENEMGIIRTHPGVGGDILSESAFPWPLREMVEQHHERIDGSGYPNGLDGDHIIPEAKVIAVADVVESITAHRPYRPSLGIDKGLDEIRRGRGKIYDPEAVDACLALFETGKFAWQAGQGLKQLAQ